MSEVTAPIMTDATGQSIDGKLNSLLGKMDNLAAAFQPNASGIVYSNTTSGLTGDDVQEAIDEMAADVSEIKQSLVDLNNFKSLFDGYLEFRGTLGGNVITTANNINLGITFYQNSNNPTNAPSSIGWGCYMFIKVSSTNVAILCWDNAHMSVTYSLNPTTATSVNWNTIK